MFRFDSLQTTLRLRQQQNVGLHWARTESMAAAVATVRAECNTEYFICDEFQDCNHEQVELLAAVGQLHLTVVGDCDQSIYGFRDAYWEEVKATFDTCMPPASRTGLLLATNYRSTPQIVDCCLSVLQPNYPDSAPKPLRAHKGKGRPVTVRKCASNEDERAFVIDELQKHRNESCAMLFFKNEDAADMARYLTQRGGLGPVTMLREDEEVETAQLAVGTVHSAKGLQWDVVFFMHVHTPWKDFVAKPHAPEIKEAVRKAYVALSRAAVRLVITYPADKHDLHFSLKPLLTLTADIVEQTSSPSSPAGSPQLAVVAGPSSAPTRLVAAGTPSSPRGGAVERRPTTGQGLGGRKRRTAAAVPAAKRSIGFAPATVQDDNADGSQTACPCGATIAADCKC